MDEKELVRQAFLARAYAYAPYSGYLVGAALLAANGRVYLGCNIENAAYSPTNCAERTAFFKAVSEGVTEFTAIAVTGGHRDAHTDEFTYFYPCGVCRQVMAEFCDPQTFTVITARTEEEYTVRTLGQLLPDGFSSGRFTQNM